jgi:hypothetical protein
VLDDTTVTPDETGEMRYNVGDFQFKDQYGTFNPRNGSGGITEPEHEALDTLVHDLSENFYMEVLRVSGKITSAVVWTDAGKTKKVREWSLTRNSIGKVSQLVTKQYDGTGAVKYTLTETFTRSCGRVATVTAVKT